MQQQITIDNFCPILPRGPYRGIRYERWLRARCITIRLLSVMEARWRSSRGLDVLALSEDMFSFGQGF